MTEAKTETRLATLVSMARAGLDYEFFTILSDRIEQASVEQKPHLTELREKLLTMTKEIDEQMKERLEASRKLLDQILRIREYRTGYRGSAARAGRLFRGCAAQRDGTGAPEGRPGPPWKTSAGG